MRRLLSHSILILFAAMSAFPLLWMAATSLKSPDRIVDSLLIWPGDAVSLDAYRRVLAEPMLRSAMVNSLFAASCVTVLSTLLSSAAAYALAWHRFRGRGMIFALLFASLLAPAQTLLPGSRELMERLGGIDRFWAISLVPAISAGGVLLLRKSMQQIPAELLAAARIDGASEVRLWWHIARPSTRAMSSTYALLTFLGSWNALLWPQVVMQSESKFTLPMVLANLSTQESWQADFPSLMAATVLTLLPVIAMFCFVQRDLSESLDAIGQ